MKKYTVFVIFAYKDKDPINGNFIESVQLEIIANSIDKAMKRAKLLIPKPNYYLKMIIEKYV